MMKKLVIGVAAVILAGGLLSGEAQQPKQEQKVMVDRSISVIF